MTAVLQTYSRKTKIAIDTLTFDTKFTRMYLDDLTEFPPIGDYIIGMYMQGARFDLEALRICESKPAELFFSMPAINLVPIASEEFVVGGRYKVPLYKTSLRAGTLSTTGHSTNFVAPLYIDSALERHHWIRRGVAMLCMLDD